MGFSFFLLLSLTTFPCRPKWGLGQYSHYWNIGNNLFTCASEQGHSRFHGNCNQSGYVDKSRHTWKTPRRNSSISSSSIQSIFQRLPASSGIFRRLPASSSVFQRCLIWCLILLHTCWFFLPSTDESECLCVALHLFIPSPKVWCGLWFHHDYSSSWTQKTKTPLRPRSVCT